MRRRIKVRRKQAGELGHQADAGIERLVLRRLDHILPVGRFIAGWVALVVLVGVCLGVQAQNLSNYYEFIKPVAGGLRSEGMMGGFTTANPLYTTNTVDSTVSRLVFNGLFTYDEHNTLVGDLAESWTVGGSEVVYTVKLKQNVQWQDGAPFTSEDVVFTYKTIQNPDAQSPLYGSWQNITVAATDKYTVTFTLSNPLSSFQYSMTNGIVPSHILKDIAPANLRTAEFNTQSPIGTGPFAWKRVEVKGNSQKNREERVTLTASINYYKGKPLLDGFIVRAFQDRDYMINQFKEGEITALVGLDDVPDTLKNDSALVTYDFRLAASMMTFFKTSEGILQDGTIRTALVRATNQQKVLDVVGYPAIPVTQPFLRGQIGYDPGINQDAFDLSAAQQLLQDAGWIVGKNGIRSKDGKQLRFTLYAKNTPEFTRVSTELQNQWRLAGIDAQVLLQSDAEFDATVSSHAYEALLYGLTIGPDPDVYAYWHSSQADVRSMSRLNFSEYKSDTVDLAIEGGRTRFDPALRTVKYKPFLETWKKDAPAIGLYQPRFLYISRGQVYGLNEHPITTQTGRFYNVQDWMVRRTRVAE